MAKNNIINWPNQTTLTARSSTITSAFVHSITPWITELSSEKEQEIRNLYEEVKNKYGIEILGFNKKTTNVLIVVNPQTQQTISIRLLTVRQHLVV
jgi:hypothetical protein